MAARNYKRTEEKVAKLITQIFMRGLSINDIALITGNHPRVIEDMIREITKKVKRWTPT